MNNYASRLEYFYKKTIKMIKNRMTYPDYDEVVDEFEEKESTDKGIYCCFYCVAFIFLHLC